MRVLPHRLRRTRTGATVAVTAAAGLALATLTAAPVAAADATGTMHVVVSGLDNPRGLALGPNGTLYVGEAGHAGPTCLGAPGELGPTCIGMTSRISAVRLRSGARSTLVGGLPSIGTAVGATGVDGVAYGDGKVAGIITGSPQGAPPDPCAGSTDPSCASVVAAALRRLGDLVVVRHHRARSVAEVGTFDYRFIVANKASLDPANPDFQPGDANPYGITATRGGWYVVDAGSNTLDFVDKKGHVRVLTDDTGAPVYFPNPPGDPSQRFPYDDVPTCVATYHGAVWVGSLSGRVWRYDGHRHVSLVADRSDGLTAINGCAVDPEGHLWVSNIFGVTQDTFFAPGSGSIMEVFANGSTRTVASHVDFPSGIAISRKGTVYVALHSICPKDLSLVSPQDPPVCQHTGAVVTVAR